jgi:transcriptional regulator with XRE-family HTH domain
MKTNERVRGTLARQLENPEFRKGFEEGYAAFELEVQILNAMEHKGWSYSKLAEVVHTSKGNISRDLKAGGILSASFSRIARMADALGMKLVALLIPKEQASYVLPRIEDIVRRSFNAAYGGPQVNPFGLSAFASMVTINAASVCTISEPGSSPAFTIANQSGVTQ